MTDTMARGAGPAERAHHAGGDGLAPERRRRMSAKRKQSAVLRLLRGEDLELVSRELGVTAVELTAWRDAFLAAGEASLKTRPADGRDVEIGLVEGQGRGSDHGQRAVGDQDRAPGGGPPFAPVEVEAMSRQVSPSAHRPYGVLRVTRVWGTSRAALYRHRRCDEPSLRRRPGPRGPMPDVALVEAIRQLLADSPFHARATARSGRGCASPGFPPPSVASCG